MVACETCSDLGEALEFVMNLAGCELTFSKQPSLELASFNVGPHLCCYFAILPEQDYFICIL
jgi:hypothetical protein